MAKEQNIIVTMNARVWRVNGEWRKSSSRSTIIHCHTETASPFGFAFFLFSPAVANRIATEDFRKRRKRAKVYKKNIHKAVLLLSKGISHRDKKR
jgi:hypothetical protein